MLSKLKANFNLKSNPMFNFIERRTKKVRMRQESSLAQHLLSAGSFQFLNPIQSCKITAP